MMLAQPLEVVYSHLEAKLGKPEETKVEKTIEEFEIPLPEKQADPKDAEMKEAVKDEDKEVEQELKSPSPQKPQAEDQKTPPAKVQEKVVEAPVSSPPPTASPQSAKKMQSQSHFCVCRNRPSSTLSRNK